MVYNISQDLDEYIQQQLVMAAYTYSNSRFKITQFILKEGGTFISKVFRATDLPLLTSQLQLFFSFVTICKPRSSRDSSIEAFVVCRGYKAPEGYVPSMNDDTSISAANAVIVPFLACGDLNGFDSDMSYPVIFGNAILEPVQGPIDPPYKSYFERLNI